MSVLTTHQARSDQWRTSDSISSGATFWTNTKDASPVTIIVPTPTFVIGVKSSSFVPLGIVRTPLTGERRFSKIMATTSAASSSVAPPPPANPAELVDRATLPHSAEIAEQPPAPSPPSVSAELMDRATPLDLAENARQPPAQSRQIELVIDSLPSYPTLAEPIPVSVESLGDRLFTATIQDLDICGTADSISEIFLNIKDEIEKKINEISKKTNLNQREQIYFHFLQHHIGISIHDPKQPKKTRWGRR